MGNIYAYMRISTAEERGLQKYSRQEKALERYAEQNGIAYLITFKEDKSGKTFVGRDEWHRLEKIAQPGDMIVFKDITRFTREAENGYSKYMELMNKGVELVFIDNPTVSTDYIKDLLHIAESQEIVTKTVMESMVKILLISELARAEKERETLSKRIKDGIEASEKKSGRKTGQLDKMTDDLKADILKYLADTKREIKAADIMRKHGISRNTFKKYVSIVHDTM